MRLSRLEYDRLAALIAERTGLTFPASRRSDFEQALQAALGERAPDGRLRDLLEGDTVARDELIANLTIGESYFFRDPGQFRLLREEILPGIAALRENVPIRMWSAGCAAGEEAYSLAILGEQLGLKQRTRVLGTDISRVRLAAARAGNYSKWALRSLDEETIARYFTESGKRYVLRSEFRGSVDFRYLNLAEDAYPSMAAGIWGFDLILCRNVLIYFDTATIAHVAQRLIDSLSDDGWLMLGASDPAISEMVDCEVVLTHAGLMYRRSGVLSHGGGATLPDAFADISAADAASRGGAFATDGLAWDLEADEPAAGGDAATGLDTPDDAVGARVAARHADAVDTRAAPAADSAVPDEVRAAYAAHDYVRSAALAAAHLAIHDTPSLRAMRVRALANMGQLSAAGNASAAALEQHRDSAELLYLHALLLLEGSQWREAAAAARRALYVDRTMVVAHLTLADALKRGGQLTGARRALNNAASLLEALPDDQVVPASDGETAGRLRTNVEARLRLMENST